MTKYQTEKPLHTTKSQSGITIQNPRIKASKNRNRMCIHECECEQYTKRGFSSNKYKKKEKKKYFFFVFTAMTLKKCAYKDGFRVEIFRFNRSKI